jgi:8-oxo-dGTP pyrophosphatase MutT (NUDIX family)
MTNGKIATHSIALAISPAAGGNRVLLVLRPNDDETLPSSWTLPAISLEPTEAEPEAIRRAGHEKLGVAVAARGLLGEAETDRSDYSHRMRVHEATIDNGVPKVPQPHKGTQYVDWRWADPAELKPAARAGSLGAQVLLRAREVPW